MSTMSILEQAEQRLDYISKYTISGSVTAEEAVAILEELKRLRKVLACESL
jgi:hypothetical protein